MDLFVVPATTAAAKSKTRRQKIVLHDLTTEKRGSKRYRERKAPSRKFSKREQESGCAEETERVNGARASGKTHARVAPNEKAAKQ